MPTPVRLELPRREVFAQPVGQRRFIQGAVCQRKNECHYLFLRGVNSKSVQPEEQVHSLESDPLVAIDKRVVAGDSKSVRCRDGREVSIGLVVKSVARALQSRFE